MGKEINRTVVAIVLIGVASAVFLWWAPRATQSSPTQPWAPTPGVTRADAMAACQGFVKNRLKAPATAVWSPPTDVQLPRSNEWVISGYVDSQNSFGALLRTQFTCDMSVTDQRWTLQSLTTSP